MSNSPTPPNPASRAEDPQVAASTEAVPVVAGPSFEDHLRAFWAANRSRVVTLVAVILLVILGKGLWEMYQAQREAGIAEQFAKAKTSEQLRRFTVEHPGDALAGVAHLRLADEAYEAGKFGDAATSYGQAMAVLSDGPLASRARIGQGISQVLAGNREAGVASLKAVTDDLTAPVSVRAEAGYHVASLAAEAGDAAGLQAQLEQLSRIAPQSLWVQRASLLRPVSAAASSPAPSAAPSASPAVTFPTKGK
jgi:predicted negative regulator of RcsB-dependent stress response